MNLELSTFNNLPAGMQHDIAELVSDYTSGKLDEQPQMLPVQPEMIFDKHMGVVALSEGMFAGYVGATDPINHNGMAMPEVGSLWVPTKYRKQGIAHRLVQVISDKLVADGEIPYAFCNPLSNAIFEQAGYTEAQIPEVPAAAFGACAGCPMLPASGGCCDTPVIRKGL